MPTKQEKLDRVNARIDAANARSAACQANYECDTILEDIDRRIKRLLKRRARIQAE